MLSIIIITLNEEKKIGKLLKNLKQQTFQNFEVIIVDSNSSDQTRLIAAQNSQGFQEYRFHKMNKRGASLGRNTGAKLAKYEKILFLDADVLLPTNFLTNILLQTKQKKLAVASAYIKLSKQNWIHNIGYQATNLGLFITQFFSPTAVGACILSTKTIHQKINGFNENIYLCEDCDYVKRASQISRFRILPMFFFFDNRRLELEGDFSAFWKYFRANATRFLFRKELQKENCKIKYEFGHYNSKKQ